MQREVISDKQGIALIILFIIGTSIIYASGINAKKDIWIAITLSVIAAIPFALIYARFSNIFGGKNLFDICMICFGKIIGKAIAIIYIWFFFHTGVLVLMNLSLFIRASSLVRTPNIITMVAIVILCGWIAREGIEVIGRWARFFQNTFLALIIGTILILLPKMNVDNVRPVLYEGVKPVLIGAIGTFSFPFTQIAVFTAVLTNFRNDKDSVKIYMQGLLIGGGLILATSLMNLLVLGVNYASSVYYPSHQSAARIEMGNIIHNIEIIISVSFTIGAFVKGSIYLLATCNGISSVFENPDYRFIVVPVSIMMINLSYFLHVGTMDYFDWILDVWVYYAIPFQIVVPIIIWIIGEKKMKKLGENHI